MNPCRMPRLASPVDRTRDLLGAEVDRAADVEPRAVADQPELVQADALLVVRDAQRPVVAHDVVEQTQRERVDTRVDPEMLRDCAARR